MIVGYSYELCLRISLMFYKYFNYICLRNYSSYKDNFYNNILCITNVNFLLLHDKFYLFCHIQAIAFFPPHRYRRVNI